MTKNNVIVFKDPQFIFGRLWRIKQSEACLMDKELSRETLQIEFFRKLLSRFRREIIQCFDSLSKAYFHDNKANFGAVPGYVEQHQNELDVAHTDKPYYSTKEDNSSMAVLPIFIDQPNNKIEEYRTI